MALRNDVAADRPWVYGKAPHLRLGPGSVAPFALLPGDPGRVDQIGDLLENFQIIASNREFRTGRGRYRGIDVMVTSTGIGGPSTEIAVIELLNLGVRTLIRVGGCGAIQPHIGPGDLIISTGAVRLGGASVQYAPPEFPAIAYHEVVMALVQAAGQARAPYHVGVGATTATYYEGQGRVAVPGHPLHRNDRLLDELRALGVLNLEMEAETIFTLATIYGARSGAILAVHGNRYTDAWLTDFEPYLLAACRIALSATYFLSCWDQMAVEAGETHFYPALRPLGDKNINREGIIS